MSYLKGTQGVSDFWQRVLNNSTQLKDHINDKDKEILSHLTNVETETKDDEKTKHTLLSLRLHFAPDNDWLSNSMLEVTLDYDNAEDGSIEKVNGTEIEWLEGKDPTKKKIKKKQKHKKTGEMRTVMKTVDCQSIFSIFESRVRPEKEEAGGNTDDEDEFEEKMDMAQQIVEHFDEELVPEALSYFLNFQIEYDFGMGEEDEGDDDDDSDEDDKEKDGEASPEEKPKKKKGGKKKGGEDADPAKGGEDQKECKQQ